MVIAIPMLNVKMDWLVVPTTVEPAGQVVTIAATFQCVMTIQVQLGIAVGLTTNVEKEPEIAILMTNVKTDWSANLMVVDQIGLRDTTVVFFPDYLTRCQT